MPEKPRVTSREVACDFFRVNAGASGRYDFISIINSVYAAKSAASDRNVTIDDGMLRLHEWQAEDGVASGALLRLRTEASASIGHIDTDELRDISLRAGEALTEYFCFSYYSEFQVLVVHRNRYAGSHQRLEYYLQRMHRHRPIEFKPILTTTAQSQMDAMGDVTIAIVKLAMPTNNQVYDTGNEAVNEMIRLGQRTGAVTLSLKVSVDHSRGILSRDVKEIWRTIKDRLAPQTRERLLPATTVLAVDEAPSVEAATLHGYRGRDSDELVTIDLIADRMAERVTIRTAGKRATLAELQGATATAYQNRYEELRDQFETNHGA